jgi:pimeloyl-ACP methyl ester carboxylesterase
VSHGNEEFMSPAEILKSMKVGFMEGPNGYREGLPTLLMIHGAGGRSRIWQNQLRVLGNEINTLAIDLPGHGETPGPGRDAIDAYTGWLETLLARLASRAPFLMGHSLGGAVVQEAALQFPEHIGGIVLAATGPHLPVAPPLLEGMKNRFEEIVDTVIKYAYAPDADPILIREGARLMKESGATVVHDDFLACDRFDRRRDVSGIHLPCLIICGEEDKLTPPALSKGLNRSIGGSRLVLLPSAGHMVMIENFRGFNQAVQEFVLANSN